MQWRAPISTVSTVALPNPRWTRATSYHSDVPRLLQLPHPVPARHQASRLSCSGLPCPWEDSSNCSVHADNLAPLGSQDDTTRHQTPECPIHHLHRWLGNNGDTKRWRWNRGNRRRPGQPDDPPHEATARSSFLLIIRRRESGHAHRVAPAITCSRGHLHG